MATVKSCNSYDCKYMTKTKTGCTADIEIVDGVCVTYFKGKDTDIKINPMHRTKGGAYVNNRGCLR